MAALSHPFRPSAAIEAESQLTDFVRFCERETGRRFADHAALHDFSVSDYRRFWLSFLEWTRVAYEGSPKPTCTIDRCETATFFPNLRLSYVEALLEVDSPELTDPVALIAHRSFRPPERVTRAELRHRVRNVASHLRRLGVTRGDRIVAVAGNNPELVVAALATAAVGATFSSAAPDIGVDALISRFARLRPTLLVANLEQGGEAGSTELSDRIDALSRALASLTGVIALDDGPASRRSPVPVHRLSELQRTPADESDPNWERFPFNHPLFVMFSSGTTGPPKCIVHGAGGTLLEHLKEHRLHVDLRSGDRLLFQTSAAWMMWNWQLSALASGSTIVLYDGPLVGPEDLWEIVARERVTVFGTNPTYLQLCQDNGFSPRDQLALPDLRAVLSTGSILHDHQYDWVREHVGELPLQSISGGTDILGCFVLGNPNLPVRRGWIQCRSLGLDVQALPAVAAGSPVGELVCRNPFPSRPLGFVEDDGTQFHEAYFAQNPGVWTHGDLIEFDADGRARMHGRSDGVLMVNGVRIGPGEILRALQPLQEVRQAMAIERKEPVAGTAGTSVVLLVVLAEPWKLDGRLTLRIRRALVHRATAMHVPDLVVQVDELPVTHNGKPSERAARDAVNGVPASNGSALANPESLDRIRSAIAAANEQRRELVEAAEHARGSSTEDLLLAIWESVLGISPLHPDDNFFEIGGTSLAAVRLFQAIHDRMGVDLPLSTLLHAQTARTMAVIVESPSEQRAPLLVLLRPGADEPALFLVHAITGDVLNLRALALGLDTNRPVYGVRARGLDPRQQPDTTVEAMARSYVDAIREVQPAGPYHVAGHSFGGLLAFEVARQLGERGLEVGWLGLIDTELHPGALPWRRRWLNRVARPFRLLRAALESPRIRVPRYLRFAVLWVAPRAPIAPPPPERELGALPPLLLRLQRISLEALARYRPRPYPGSATYFRAGERAPSSDDAIPVLRDLMRDGMRIVPIPGNHADVFMEPALSIVSSAMSDELRRRERR